MTRDEALAWELYCDETAGGMDVRDFWHELPQRVQSLYIDKIARSAISPKPLG